jgi:hypothetical protein
MKTDELLKRVLVDYVGFFYKGVLTERELKNALIIFEALLDMDQDMSDFTPVMRQMQYDMDCVMV